MNKYQIVIRQAANLKKTLFLLLFLLSYQIVSSQVLIAFLFGDKLNADNMEFGIDVGLNRSSIINLEPSQHSYSLHLGITYAYHFNEKLHINPSLYYSFPMGAEGVSIYETPDTNLNAILKGAKVERNLSYISIPVLLRYKLFKLTFLDFGLQGNFLTKAEDVFTVSLFNDNDITYNADIKEQYETFDGGLVIGFSQRLKKEKGVTLALHYYNSISSISKADNQYNSVFYFNVGIPIGVGKE
ncbi:porin family protein [Carboxylicivirga linearis]|uniref:PorT family protein n=1 Tax=Carboxylicivirga linearis TaxID=1628157 RepID=A0ABS5K3K2_9BACT|nr:porin family protein [Carboxylicivirga linearis]MBS2101124.1 PorT family protein [Carboxylicivirga linearis]